MKILIIAFHFSPAQKIGAVRPSKLAKYLIKLGNDVTVLTVDANNIKNNIDPLLNNEKNLYGNVCRIKVGYLGRVADKGTKFISRTSKQAVRIKSDNNKSYNAINEKIYIKVFKNIKNKIIKILNLIYYCSWLKNCKKYMRLNYKIKSFDYVFSTYGPYEDLVIGAYAMKKGYSNYWIADFRDTIIKKEDSLIDYYKNISMLKKVCKKATFITSVSKTGLYAAYNLLPNPIKELAYKKTYTLYNGFDSDDYNYDFSILKNNNSCFKLAYCGALYGNKRDLTLLFEALNELISERKIEQDDIRIQYAGSQYKWLLAQARNYKMESVLVNYGIIPRPESIALQAQSDAILVATWNEDTVDGKGIITGKVYESILVKKPVLAIVCGSCPDSELGQLLSEYRMGSAFETSDINAKDKLKMWIVNQIEFKKSNKKLEEYREDTYNYFHYNEITKRLLEIINSAN